MKAKPSAPIHISAELQSAAEGVLQGAEKLSELVEESLRSTIARRQMKRDFIARGRASACEARRTGKYIDAESVIADLEGILKAKESG